MIKPITLIMFTMFSGCATSSSGMLMRECAAMCPVKHKTIVSEISVSRDRVTTTCKCKR